MGRSDVRQYVAKPGLATFVYNLEYELQEAAIARGLTQSELDAMPGDPIWLVDDQTLSKADLIAWYRLHLKIESTNQDIQRRDLDRKQRAQKAQSSGRQHRTHRRTGRR